MKIEICKHCNGKGKVKSKFSWGIVDTTCMCCDGKKTIEVKELKDVRLVINKDMEEFLTPKGIQVLLVALIFATSGIGLAFLIGNSRY